MSRRPSILSVLSPSSSIGNGQAKPSPPTLSKDFSSQSQRRTSTSKMPVTDNLRLDPDELFTKYTVSEVKLAQQRLRADADAKQEELRLMVGERYRDLLQASASIISIASSSKRVTEALEETKSTILAQEELPQPKQSSAPGTDDTHLHTVQVLSAHMKLLLDTPEHLWRLIERKQYFTAAWLFLLSRVVHRALVRDTELEDETWSSQGLDVLEQFPLIQRQWESISQFRSQILHKATLYLREYNVPADDICATLFTLHLLDSRPLTETFAALLDQRSKTIHSLLSPRSEHVVTSPTSPSFARQNGHPPEKSPTDKSLPDHRRSSVRQVKQSTMTVLEAISNTIKTSRTVFERRGSQPSIIETVVAHIHSDSADPQIQATLPAELQLTTQSLLMTLPSSTHFLLLPPNLRLYKPYVDLSSSSSSVPHANFVQKLEEWFGSSMEDFQGALEKWFLDLRSVKEVWNIRLFIRRWIYSASGLKDQEIQDLMSKFDNVCQRRITNIWKTAVLDAEKSFQAQLISAIASLGETADVHLAERTSVGFLFQVPPIPVSSQISSAPSDSSFQKYKATLRKQLLGRTSLLDGVLRTLEDCAKSLQHDVSQVLSGTGDDTRTLVERVTDSYRPDAEALCRHVLASLKSATEHEDDSRSRVNSLIFVGRVADELSSSSTFVSRIGCAEGVATEFRTQTRALHDNIVDRWRKFTVSRIVGEYHLALPLVSNHKASAPNPPSYPSSHLTQSLLSLSDAIREFGISRDSTRQDQLANRTLHHFIMQLVSDSSKVDGLQDLYDLALLRKLADLHDAEWTEVFKMLDLKIAEVREQLSVAPVPAPQDAASECLSRTQILLAPLLPRLPAKAAADKLAALLTYGAPGADQPYQPAIDVVKPSPRFGLLLVGSVTGR